MTTAEHRHRIAYVSDLDLRVAGGGSCVVNFHAFDQLSRRFECAYLGPIVPAPHRLDVLQSRVRRRILGRAGSFAYFAPATLDGNARAVLRGLRGDEHAIVFRSAARWARCRPSVPYFVYLDAVFHTFFHNTFRPADFIPADIERIFSEEAHFLEHAAGVFFESQWGLDRAREAYRLSGTHYHVAGRGGAFEPPAADTRRDDSKVVLTVAMDFQRKGGDLVLEAYRNLKPGFPSLTWHIVGGTPSPECLRMEGVFYEGSLDPGSPADSARFRDLLSQAFLMLHPTREDTSPLVLTEAASFGCPAVSVDAFAIPELVLNGQTGLLIPSPPDAERLTEAVSRLLDDTPAYLAMRTNARLRALEKYSWTSIGSFIGETIERSLSSPARKNPHA